MTASARRATPRLGFLVRRLLCNRPLTNVRRTVASHTCALTTMSLDIAAVRCALPRLAQPTSHTVRYYYCKGTSYCVLLQRNLPHSKILLLKGNAPGEHLGPHARCSDTNTEHGVLYWGLRPTSWSVVCMLRFACDVRLHLIAVPVQGTM